MAPCPNISSSIAVVIPLSTCTVTVTPSGVVEMLMLSSVADMCKSPSIDCSTASKLAGLSDAVASTLVPTNIVACCLAGQDTTLQSMPVLMPVYGHRIFSAHSKQAALLVARNCPW